MTSILRSLTKGNRALREISGLFSLYGTCAYLRSRAGILGYLYLRSREFISNDSTPAEYRSLITIRDLES
jgi:hypothetical protein